jgi:hypothetical protein
MTIDKNSAQAIMWSFSALLIGVAFIYARPILDTSFASLFKLTFGAHVGLIIDWYIRKRTDAKDDDPCARDRMCVLAGLGMVAFALA